jgi:hypothetical protein
MILLEVLMPTKRKLGQIMSEYRCQVPLSSAKLSNLKEGGFSNSTKSVRKENRVVQTLDEEFEPVRCVLRI